MIYRGIWLQSLQQDHRNILSGVDSPALTAERLSAGWGKAQLLFMSLGILGLTTYVGSRGSEGQ